MHTTMRKLLMAGLWLLLGTAHAQTTPSSGARGQAVRIEKDSAADRVVSKVYEGRYSFVRIETREPGAALNQHPFSIAPATLRAVLEQAELVDATPGGLLTSKQLDEIVAPLATALGRATAEQDVSFAVSDQVGALGPLASKAVTTARVFYRDGQLQLIAGLVRRDFESQFSGTGYLIAFEPGQRAKPVDAKTRLRVAEGKSSRVRNDWVVLDTSTPTSAPAAATAAGAAAPAAATAATAPAAASPAPAGRETDTLYKSTADRLRALDKLRADGLISEAEYQEKRRQILREL